MRAIRRLFTVVALAGLVPAALAASDKMSSVINTNQRGKKWQVRKRM